jgi:hypothetical protein
MADGTAPQCGRVGSCHIYLQKSLSGNAEAFCILYLPPQHFLYSQPPWEFTQTYDEHDNEPQPATPTDQEGRNKEKEDDM